MYKINYLFSNIGNNKQFIGLYIVKDNKVKLINVKEKKEENFIKKGLSISEIVDFELDEDEELLDAFFKKDKIYSKSSISKKWYYFKEAQNLPGKYYPRIYKPVISESSGGIKPRDHKVKELEKEIKQYQEFIPHNKKELISSINQLSVLSQNLSVLFQTIQPDSINYEVFGHNIRNLLILACTEVEAQFVGIIKSISSTSKDRYNTGDYIKLYKKLKLKDYSVSLGYFPLDDEIKPFENWDDSKPTQSLKWYANYNAVKHDRENEFSKATLLSVIEALAGLAILLKAQYGENLPFWKELVGGFFVFNTTPNWEIEDQYIPPFLNEEWEQIKIEL